MPSRECFGLRQRAATSAAPRGSAFEKRGRDGVALELEVCRHVGQDAGERSDPEICVVRDRDVVDAALLGGEAHVAAGLSRDLVAITPECPGELAAREIAGEPHASSRDDFVVDEVQPDRRRAVGLLEVTADGLSNGLPQSLQGIRLGENRGADGVCRIPAFGGFFDQKENFRHVDLRPEQEYCNELTALS